MTEYARYLGIDPAVDHDLMWIAEEALEAPLPSEWTEHFDSSDRVYYYNETTKGTSLTHPLENLYRDAYKTIVPKKVVLQAELEKFERELKKLKDQIAATSDKEEKSKLIKRLNEVEKQHYVTDSADVWARPLEV